MSNVASSLRQSSAPDVVVPVRRTHIAERLASLPKYFARNENVFDSHLTVALSAAFPDGEDFFVRAVRQYRDQITDPALRKQVAGFIGQESVHSREHHETNECFDALGYRATSFERFVKMRLNFVWKIAKPIDRLAITAAIEHFTACYAEMILADEVQRARFGEGAMRELFCWHALEELEHKAVAFDVYRAVGGEESRRIRNMYLVRFFFYAGVGAATLYSVARDREARSWRTLRRDAAEFRSNPLLSREFRAMLREYLEVGFHPNDRDNSDLLDAARAEFFGEQGTLSHLLAA